MAFREGDPALTPPRPALDLAAVRPKSPWGTVEYAVSLDSTNAAALRAPRPWRVVVAEEQVQGRGRLGRDWTTIPSSALAVSVVVPLAREGLLGWVPLMAGLAVRDAVGTAAGLDVALKWPNDVIVPSDDDRKLAGILCQWAPGVGVVIGVGINVLTPRSALPVDTATSVVAAGGCSRHSWTRWPGATASWVTIQREPEARTARAVPRSDVRSRCMSPLGNALAGCLASTTRVVSFWLLRRGRWPSARAMSSMCGPRDRREEVP